ncbi:hypothetical protein RFI_04894 [Reticulomyxa filosa]|uniref:Uncharacterized protein n=1 Tax=Reticulomyxa filosa TaxID=46433 RepID=X6P260_RETFI|nr:hypothetical protein RFI_04894 [Reticulomyxa filosa]|eukprot:ETO32223.1 hypothetical protein RFI_04894 [Reticulomyxa filosa]
MEQNGSKKNIKKTQHVSQLKQKTAKLFFVYAVYKSRTCTSASPASVSKKKPSLMAITCRVCKQKNSSSTKYCKVGHFFISISAIQCKWNIKGLGALSPLSTTNSTYKQTVLFYSVATRCENLYWRRRYVFFFLIACIYLFKIQNQCFKQTNKQKNNDQCKVELRDKRQGKIAAIGPRADSEGQHVQLILGKNNSKNEGIEVTWIPIQTIDKIVQCLSLYLFVSCGI